MDYVVVVIFMIVSQVNGASGQPAVSQTQYTGDIPYTNKKQCDQIAEMNRRTVAIGPNQTLTIRGECIVRNNRWPRD